MPKEKITLREGWVLYLRVSDKDHQTPERSFKMQRDAIQRTLLANSDLPVYGVYKDLLTGTNYNRADFQRMLAEAHEGRFSRIAIYRVDRFGRDTAEGLSVGKELRQLGIQIMPASNPGLDITSPDGWMLFTILLGLGEHEVGVLRLRTEAGMRAKLESGQWCWRAPDGYKNFSRQINANKRETWIEIDPERGQVCFHSLRHSFGTMLAASGVHPKTAQTLMRHSDINLTMSRYTHTLRSQEATAIESLPDLNCEAHKSKKATGTND